MKKILKNLGWQIFFALLLGILCGYFLHQFSDPSHQYYSTYNSIIINYLNPAGQIFISLIKMIVLPIIVSTLTLGISGLGSSGTLGRLGVKTILYFEVVTTLAIIIGMVLANVFQPGAGVDRAALSFTNIDKYISAAHTMEDGPHGLVVMIMDIVPSNIFSSLVNNQILAVIVFCVFFGLGLMQLEKDQKEFFNNFLRAVSNTMFKVTNMVMRYAPIGVFALMSVTVAKYGVDSLLPLVKLVILVYIGMFFFVIAVLGLVCYLFRFNIFTIIKILKEELIVAYSTATSETALPGIMEKMERYGAPRSIVSFVVPTGYTFNLDGSTLYQSITVIFLAQLFGMDISILDQLVIILTLMIASKGIAGVPGASILVLSATLASVGIPLEGIGYIMGVERILDMARTAVNVIGNAVASLVIARMEHSFDDGMARQYEADLLEKK